MTGHRSQGATLEGDVIIDVQRSVTKTRDGNEQPWPHLLLPFPHCCFSNSAFSPGLLYVMLSRVRQRSQLRIVGELTPSMFDPIIVNMHGINV